MKVRERYNPQVAKWLLENAPLADEVKQNLTLYVNKYPTGIADIKYKQGKRKGRMYTHEVSLQGMKGAVRRSIAGQFYRDVDIRNCHPTLLDQWLDEHHVA